jgi:hypothetical protein
MGTRKRRDLPARLEGTRRRFERWRRTRKTGARIPDSLWGSAVKVAATYGISRTASVLGVDYYSLKKRVHEAAAASASDGSDGGRRGPFVELAVAGSSGHTECILELEDAGGAKRRVHFRGVEAPDLAALSRSLWGIE